VLAPLLALDRGDRRRTLPAIASRRTCTLPIDTTVVEPPSKIVSRASATASLVLVLGREVNARSGGEPFGLFDLVDEHRVRQDGRAPEPVESDDLAR
jgi:hypothetical protein